eukprot:scaffold3511_cov146-Skeletonema_menzelii.AAC.17
MTRVLNGIYLEVTQTLICRTPVGRHSRDERSGHESGVQLHDAPTVLTSTADNNLGWCCYLLSCYLWWWLVTASCDVRHC